MRYVIIGAGAVGGTIGGFLFQGGHEIARDAGARPASAIESFVQQALTQAKA